MAKNNLLEFDAEILACKRKLKELEPHIKNNEALATLYNRLLVQKAILIDKKRKERNPENKIADKFRKMFTFNHRKKLICDFFQEGY
ncbi:MAG: hypothetical protein E7Z91_03580 [Cyanobacteria bacterium SIG30]|nr:hypothetical protein [Cyanobacteria bacterium SIG30]